MNGERSKNPRWDKLSDIFSGFMLSNDIKWREPSLDIETQSVTWDPSNFAPFQATKPSQEVWGNRRMGRESGEVSTHQLVFK